MSTEIKQYICYSSYSPELEYNLNGFNAIEHLKKITVERLKRKISQYQNLQLMDNTINIKVGFPKDLFDGLSYDMLSIQKKGHKVVYVTASVKRVL